MQNEVITSPEVGDLATITLWTDRTAARVISVSKSGHKVVLADLNTRVISGSVIDGSARYATDAFPSENARTSIATRRQNGIYRLQGWTSGGRVSFGYADTYRDPSF